MKSQRPNSDQANLARIRERLNAQALAFCAFDDPQPQNKLERNQATNNRRLEITNGNPT